MSSGIRHCQKGSFFCPRFEPRDHPCGLWGGGQIAWGWHPHGPPRSPPRICEIWSALAGHRACLQSMRGCQIGRTFRGDCQSKVLPTKRQRIGGRSKEGAIWCEFYSRTGVFSTQACGSFFFKGTCWSNPTNGAVTTHCPQATRTRWYAASSSQGPPPGHHGGAVLPGGQAARVVLWVRHGDGVEPRGLPVHPHPAGVRRARGPPPDRSVLPLAGLSGTGLEGFGIILILKQFVG